MDPYVVIKVDGKELRTKTMDDAGKTPVWNQDFDVNLPDKKKDVTFQVFDAGTLSDSIVGETTVKLESILTQARDVKEIEIKH
jgi:Ca2+-dependent lipid-binding protein